jgi:hypothetical protein
VTQNGGLLVVSSTGDVLYKHTEADGGDRADLTRVWPIVDNAAAALPPVATATISSTFVAAAPTPPVAAAIAPTTS